MYLIVGIRLYALSARNAQTPDRLLSVTFLFWGCSYFIYDIPEIFFYGSAQLPPLFSFSSALSLYLGTITFAAFTRAVFRPEERWALWLVAGMVCCLIVGVAGSVWVGDGSGEHPLSNPWWWVTRVGCVAPLVWMAAEGLAQYVTAVRRQRLGLCTPQVCNRFLLWGLAGSLWVALELVDGAEYFAYEMIGEYPGLLLVLVGWLEVAPGGMIWLIFFPPAIYRRWISSDAPVAKAEEG